MDSSNSLMDQLETWRELREIAMMEVKNIEESIRVGREMLDKKIEIEEKEEDNPVDADGIDLELTSI